MHNNVANNCLPYAAIDGIPSCPLGLISLSFAFCGISLFPPLLSSSVCTTDHRQSWQPLAGNVQRRIQFECVGQIPYIAWPFKCCRLRSPKSSSSSSSWAMELSRGKILQFSSVLTTPPLVFECLLSCLSMSLIIKLEIS